MRQPKVFSGNRIMAAAPRAAKIFAGQQDRFSEMSGIDAGFPNI
jgi:hypothetical protein